MTRPLLTREELQTLVDTVVDWDADYLSYRNLLFAGIPPRYVAGLNGQRSPLDQLRFDLEDLSKQHHLDDLDEPPLALWLRNAIWRAGPRLQARTLREMHATVLSRVVAAASTSVPAVHAAPTLRRATHREHTMQPHYLFSWIHLSDLHFGHGTPTHRWDQAIVLDALATDIAGQGNGSYPIPQALLVTGDIAFSGAGRSPDEYTQAETWLRRILATHGLEPSAVFLVPGNHDVNRGVEKGDRDVQRLLDAIVSGKSIDDEALSHPSDQAKLQRRQQAYLDFAAKFAPERAHLWWKHRQSIEGGTLNLIGLNTALVAAGDADQGRLQLGRAQLAEVMGSLPGPNDVVLVLTHHPVTDGWLRDQKEVATHLRTRAHIHLSGHVHDAGTLHLQTGGASTPHLSIHAGAAHGEASEAPEYCYSGAALLRDERGLVVRVWPRKWSVKNRAFRLDPDGVLDGQVFVDHVLKAAPRPQ